MTIAAPKRPASPVRARVGVNMGFALLRLAEAYPSLVAVIYEIVQNALDVNVRADRIWIRVNLKTRSLSVRDNGQGTTPDQFNEALASIATEKRKGAGSLGQFGIGLISPLGKCSKFTFTSAPRSGDLAGRFEEWIFDCEKVIKTKDDLDIPIRPRPDLTTGLPEKGRSRVEWYSEMALHGVYDDTALKDVTAEAIAAGIQARFSNTMRRNKATISIEVIDRDGSVSSIPAVKAKEFQGDPLPVWEFIDSDAGKVTVQLYVASSTGHGRNGKVLVGVAGDDFTFPLHYFARSVDVTLGSDLDDALSALKSGAFEGEIRAERVVLHATRRAFKADNAHLGLCVALESWYTEVGAQQLDRIKESKQEERHQNLGLRSMEFLASLLKDPAHDQIRRIIKGFGRGSVGAGHTAVPKKSVVGDQTQTSASTSGGSSSPRDSNNESGRGIPQTDHPEHIPLTVTGPTGQVRKLVKNSSFGLQFRYSQMRGCTELWMLDTFNGVLTFNICHALWEKCDHRDSDVMALQEHIVMQALTLETMDAATKEVQRHAFAELTHLMVAWITARPAGKIIKGGIKKK